MDRWNSGGEYKLIHNYSSFSWKVEWPHANNLKTSFIETPIFFFLVTFSENIIA